MCNQRIRRLILRGETVCSGRCKREVELYTWNVVKQLKPLKIPRLRTLRNLEIWLVAVREVWWVVVKGVRVCLIFGRRCVVAVIGGVRVILLKLSDSFLLLALHFSPLGSSVFKPNLEWRKEFKWVLMKPPFELQGLLFDNLSHW